MSAATEARVRAAIDELGYRVDRAARGLVTGRRETVALVIPDIGDPFAAQLTLGVTRSLGTRYRVILVVTGPEPTSRTELDDVLALGIDGVIVDSLSALQAVPNAHPGPPVVLLDAPGTTSGLPRVDFDIEQGALALAEHLLALGHRRFAYLDWAREASTFDVRRERFLASARAAGAAVDVQRSAITVDAGAAAFRTHWEAWRDAGVTALVCCTDLQAYGVLRETASCGVSVPGSLSVAGFNDLEFSALISPPLTTVRLSALELGLASGELLIRLIEGTETALAAVRLPAPLVVRASTGPPQPVDAEHGMTRSRRADLVGASGD